MFENLFVTVPAVTLPNGVVIPSFKIGQYPCTQMEGKAAVVVDGAPWIVNDWQAARKACEEAGFKLLTELQHQAISVNIGGQKINLTIKNGKNVLFFERRWFQLSNGKRVFDLGQQIWVSPSKDTGALFESDKGNFSFRCTK